MDFLWVLFAYACGLGVKLLGLPPLIGFLAAGFGLHALNVEPIAGLEMLADLGITLMLFTIGLKLNIKDLFKLEVWGSSLAHMGVWTLILIGLCLFLASLSLPFFSDLSLAQAALIGFSFSFSSTVCIVKLLEENGEIKTRHGQLALGILVMQDIVAVVFLVAATGKMPTPWGFALIGLYWLRPVLFRLLEKAGHGEMLPLSGFFFALGGYELFYLCDIKGDLGALVMGMLLSSHPKASELTKSLLSFKDLFLIGFFLSIGFTALPTVSMLIAAMSLSLVLLLKFAMFFGVLVLLRLRSRTAYLSSLVLSNYSEFGLIVAALSVEMGWLSKDWLVIIALAVSISFIVTSVVYPKAHTIYTKYKDLLHKFESERRLAVDEIDQPADAEILVIGMGRVGKSAYTALEKEVQDKVAGLDSDRSRGQRLCRHGMNVIIGDGEDADFWQAFDTSGIRLVLLALPSMDDIRNVTYQLRNADYHGPVAAIARYEDDRAKLLEYGIDNVFNFYKEAGTGFAEDSLALIKQA